MTQPPRGLCFPLKQKNGIGMITTKRAIEKKKEIPL